MAWLNKFFILIMLSSTLLSQDNLESFLDPIDENTIINGTFLSTRIINGHSVEMFGPGALDVRISHRFGALNTGFYEMFGLDQATIRIGLEYGLSKNIMIGFGRSSERKNYDGFLKYSIIKQSKNQKIPLSIVYFGSISMETEKKVYLANYPISGKISYCNQLLIASKLNDNISMQLIPTFIHRNMVQNSTFFHDVFLLGTAIKCKLTRSTSLNLEYHYRITDQDMLDGMSIFSNSFGVGLDIETGGHVFQIHLTNSLPMYESGFLTRTNQSWSDGGIHFGFNISREFTLK